MKTNTASQLPYWSAGARGCCQRIHHEYDTHMVDPLSAHEVTPIHLPVRLELLSFFAVAMSFACASGRVNRTRCGDGRRAKRRAMGWWPGLHGWAGALAGTLGSAGWNTWECSWEHLGAWLAGTRGGACWSQALGYHAPYRRPPLAVLSHRQNERGQLLDTVPQLSPPYSQHRLLMTVAKRTVRPPLKNFLAS